MIDFHAHLDLFPDPGEVASECSRRGICVLSVTTTPRAWRGTLSLAVGHPSTRTALGLHPQLVADRAHELSLFDKLVEQAPFIGEVGLDGGDEFRSHLGLQIEVFEHILARCSELGGRVLSIHSRRASSAVLQILERWSSAGTPILHWFSGTPAQLERAADLGCWFSVGPAMLRGKRGRALASRMPRDRVLTESDGPFARIDGNPLMPWDVIVAERNLAMIWEVPVPEVQRQLGENVRRLVPGLERPGPTPQG